MPPKKTAAKKAKKAVPLDPAEARKQAAYERRQALRLKQGIATD